MAVLDCRGLNVYIYDGEISAKESMSGFYPTRVAFAEESALLSRQTNERSVLAHYTNVRAHFRQQRMVEIVEHPAFPQPSNAGSSIWRYLSWEKFEWMAREHRLFMPQANRLGDPLEGTQPLGDTNWWQTQLDTTSTKDARRNIEHNRELISNFANAFRGMYYVSCWHQNDVINMAMWAEYAQGCESVAIQATTLSLCSVLPSYVNTGVVRYVDYAMSRLPTLNMLEYITHKNITFAHERELRAVALQPVVDGLGKDHFGKSHFVAVADSSFRVFAPCVNLGSLVNAVFVHQCASQQFEDKVSVLCSEAGLPQPQRAAI
jgi:hypothetical protein